MQSTRLRHFCAARLCAWRRSDCGRLALTDDENPWRELRRSEGRWVLAEDAAAIERLNLGPSVTDGTRVRLELLPVPFVGRRDAPVVLLNLNPGFDERDYEAESRPNVEALVMANLRHGLDSFFPLRPELAGTSAWEWWRGHLRHLATATSWEVVERNIFCVEYFGYHSSKYEPGDLVPSQQYGFSLVRAAMKRDALIVSMRAHKRWTTAIPELASYPRIFRLDSPQNVVVSPDNCPPGKFDLLVDTLRNATKQRWDG